MLESHIRIMATMPEMYTFFKKETGVRFMEIRDTQYSSDEIDRMPAAERDKETLIQLVRDSSAS